MANLLGQNIGTNYKGILSLDSTINTPLDATLRAVTDGEGNASGLKLSTSDSSFSGKLGVGTDTPTAKLEVNGVGTDNIFNCYQADGTTLALSVGWTGNFQTYNTFFAGGVIWASGTTDLRLGTNMYDTAITIKSADGKVGINTNSPLATTHIKGSGTTSATTSLLVQNSAGNTSLQVTDEQQVTGFSGTQIRFRLGVTSGGQGISTRDGECSFGIIDANQSSGLRLLSTGSGSSYIDGYTEGASKASNYPLFIGSRANNTGISVTDSTTQENGTATFFGSAVSYPSAIVGINSTTRGFLPPRMTTTQKNAIATPAAGLVVYDSTTNKLACYNGTTWNDLF